MIIIKIHYKVPVLNKRANSYNSKSIVNKSTDYDHGGKPFLGGIPYCKRVLDQSGLRQRGLVGINYLCHMQVVICRRNKHIRLLLDFNSKYSEYSCE